MNNEDFYWKQDFEELVSMCEVRDNKIAELKETIDKAIKYIKDNKWRFITEFGYATDYDVVETNDLLKILGDKE